MTPRLKVPAPHWLSVSVLLLVLGCGGDPVGIAITGRVVDDLLQPVAGIRVRVDGGADQVTGSDGAFNGSTSGTYEVSLEDTSTGFVLVYQGLHRADPTLELLDWNPQYSTSSEHGTIAGQLSGGSGYPLPPNFYSLVSFVSRGVFATGVGNGMTGGYSFDISPAAAVGGGTVYALQFDLGSAGDPNGPAKYTGYGMRANIPPAHVAEIVSGQDVVLSAVSTDSLIATVALPPGYGMIAKQLVFSFSRDGGAPASLPIWTDHGTSPSLLFRVPVGTRIMSDVLLDVFGQGREEIWFTKTNLPHESPGTTIALPAGVSLLSPAGNASGVNQTTEFHWSGNPGRVYLWRGPGLQVVTTETTVQPSSLKSSRLRLSPGVQTGWSVHAFGLFNTLDDATGPNGFNILGDRFRAQSDPRHFTP